MPMRVAIVSMRYLGDCVVAAALAGAIKQKFPSAEVWMITFKRNTSILQGIDSIDGVLGFDSHPGAIQQVRDLLSIRNSFDWSFVTHSSTRAFLYGAAAAKRVCMHLTKKNTKLWRRFFITDLVPAPHAGHKLDLIAVLLKPLIGYVPNPSPVAPFCSLPEEMQREIESRPFVVFHLCSQYEDKNISVDCWRALGQKVQKAGFRVVFTGGGSNFENQQIKAVSSNWHIEDYLNLSGKLSFGQTGALLKQASAYVGVDTATTHVAAATGCATIVPFGPTSAVKWGPAPKNAPRTYRDDCILQRSGNVSVIRNPAYLGCRSCRSDHKARCPRWEHQNLSVCLQTMPEALLWEELKYRLIQAGAKVVRD